MYAPNWGEKTSLGKIPGTLGMTDVAVPIPSYLPENCEIKEVYLGEVKHGEYGAIRFVISDVEVEHQGEEVKCVLLMHTRWMRKGPAGGLKIPGTSYFELGRTGIAALDQTDDPVALWVQLRQFEIVVLASKDFPTEELIKVAESALD
jgi:hypothetical protein